MFNKIGVYHLVATTVLLLGAQISSFVSAQDLVVDGPSDVRYLHGRITQYENISVINGGKIIVDAFADGAPTFDGTGNLELVAQTIYVDAQSEINADGAGYQPLICGNGGAPASYPQAGGVGGCAVRDSGGGGAHFGVGGRGTKDCSGTCNFPQDWEEDCGNSLNTGYDDCTTTSDCRDNDALPTVAGQPFIHSIWEVEFGGAGGDKGCRDGDGFDPPSDWSGPWNPYSFAGAGGGRIVLVGTKGDLSGSVTIEGTIRSIGWRGCGHRNDSSGGGAGGSILVVGDNVAIGENAKIWASGGVGGDTRGLDGDTYFNVYRGQQCPAGYQDSGTCDDCAGGGGGGIISVLSRNQADIQAGADFDVAGSIGGNCTAAGCQGEAGGGAGELQINGGWTGEICDGYDNDFDGLTDEVADLGYITCSIGSCIVPDIVACENGAPNYCIPFDDPACLEPTPDTRPRFALILDTSGSMLTDLNGKYTFGDGSLEHPGHSGADDSRLYLAKNALAQTIAAYPEIDWSLARFSQDQGLNRSCQLATWFECNDICCTYDNPEGNTGTEMCSVEIASGSVAVNQDSPTLDQCVNYAGNCGSKGDGADILVGFGANINQHLMWIDHKETNFINTSTPGDYCDYQSNGDCELRGTGPTPLADSLLTYKSYLQAVKNTDPYDEGSCRRYSLILLTDGAETCGGDPITEAADLLSQLNIQTFVIGFSVLPEEESLLNAIADSGGTTSAYLVNNADALASALAEIVSDSVVFELCNGADDDCDGLIDEDFVDLGGFCTDSNLGICQGTGTFICTEDNTSVECEIINPGQSSTTEVCNGLDDDCDGLVDEGLNCDDCVPSGQDICDGIDNDCDGATDEDFVSADCGFQAIGQCIPGVTQCNAGEVECSGGQGPIEEACNNLDDDCDGQTDGIVEPCYPDSVNGCEETGMPPTWNCLGECQPGLEHCTGGVFGDCLNAVIPSDEVCNGVDDDCNGSTDESFPEAGLTCGQSDVGVCSLGTYQCINGVLECDGAVWGTSNEHNVPEFCDGMDNDCDGVTDENAVEAICGSDLGLCESGTMMCHEISAGVWEYECVGATVGTPEQCDTLDNDCDGETDEGLISADTCTNSQTSNPNEGICKEGQVSCINGQWQCNANERQVEICDLLDNDCDGLTDEDSNFECPGDVCVEGECPALCGDFEFSCPTGQICEEVEGEKICIPNVCEAGTLDALPCVDNQYWCSNGFTPKCHCDVVSKQCVDSCYEVQCDPGSICVTQLDGQCVAQTDSCYVIGCDEGLICVGEACIEDPCATKECPENQYCNNEGNCVSPCDALDCPPGWGCYENQCIEDQCAGVVCKEDQTCIEGECIASDCQQDQCEFYQICEDGQCIDDTCWNIQCPNGYFCLDGACYDPDYETPDSPKDSDDDPFDDTDIETDDSPDSNDEIINTDEQPFNSNIMATGSGGCLCSSGVGTNNNPTFGLAFILIGLAFFAFKVLGGNKKTVRIIIFSTILFLLLGCETRPYKFQSDSSPIGDTNTNQQIDTNPPFDTNGADSSTQTDTSSQAFECDTDNEDANCDGIDDDCDGQTDEGVDTANNPFHCGGCNNACDFDHAVDLCENGNCKMGQCDGYAKNLDSDSNNGCEYVCVPGSEYDLCNGVDLQDTDNPYIPRDDDCDGQFDEDEDFDTDPSNCGWCGHYCDFERATNYCTGGVCFMSDCQNGYWDINNNPADGCEYACTLGADTDEVCDGFDNDCNGQTDEAHGVPNELGVPCYTGTGGCTGNPLTCEGICQTGTIDCIDKQIVCNNQITPSIMETCNGLDDNCNGAIDEGLIGTVNHCTGCNIPCNLPNAVSQCTGGACTILACQFGYVDLDTDLPGCEYQCTQNGQEICDGLDNDCNGLTDTDDGDLFVPDNFCFKKGPCSGTEPSCSSACGVYGWYCNYNSAQVEITDPCSPNQIVLEETICDDYDGDCDGMTDESFPLKGEPCSEIVDTEHPYGACLSTGNHICDPADSSQTICQLTTIGQSPKQEQCNALDDDCDGVIDNGEVDELIHVVKGGLDFYIYAYEASKVDSSSTSHGNSAARACSKSSVLPWNAVTFEQAQLACAAAGGKRLCTAEEWLAACESTDEYLYPYGDDYEDQYCNGKEYDDDNDEIISTGQLAQCVSGFGGYDLSGNLREWTTEEPQEGIYVVRGGSYNTPAIGLTCDFTTSRASDDIVLPAIGFRCCLD